MVAFPKKRKAQVNKTITMTYIQTQTRETASKIILPVTGSAKGGPYFIAGQWHGPQVWWGKNSPEVGGPLGQGLLVSVDCKKS